MPSIKVSGPPEGGAQACATGSLHGDLEQHICHLEVIAEWRDDLLARIAREILIFEFGDCTRREEFDALEAEVALFNRVCLAIAAVGPEGGAA